MTDQDRTPRFLYARVCRPAEDGPARVAVLNHGTGPNRFVLEPYGCADEAPGWFLRRDMARAVGH